MTQHDLIVRHLRDGGSLTVAESLDRYGIYALSQRIGELNKRGWHIEPVMEKNGGKSYARYYMRHCPVCHKGELFGEHLTGTIEHRAKG